MPSSGVGWQPSRFLTDRAEAERAYALAEQLGSVTAAAADLPQQPKKGDGSRCPLIHITWVALTMIQAEGMSIITQAGWLTALLGGHPPDLRAPYAVRTRQNC